MSLNGFGRISSRLLRVPAIARAAGEWAAGGHEAGAIKGYAEAEGEDWLAFGQWRPRG